MWMGNDNGYVNWDHINHATAVNDARESYAMQQLFAKNLFERIYGQPNQQGMGWNDALNTAKGAVGDVYKEAAGMIPFGDTSSLGAERRRVSFGDKILGLAQALYGANQQNKDNMFRTMMGAMPQGINYRPSAGGTGGGGGTGGTGGGGGGMFSYLGNMIQGSQFNPMGANGFNAPASNNYGMAGGGASVVGNGDYTGGQYKTTTGQATAINTPNATKSGTVAPTNQTPEEYRRKILEESAKSNMLGLDKWNPYPNATKTEIWNMGHNSPFGSSLSNGGY